MKYLLEITKIVEAAIANDRRKLLGYLDQLTRKVKKMLNLIRLCRGWQTLRF